MASTVVRPRRGDPGARRGSLYRGGEGMWSWVAHRVTGVLTFFFLFAHVLDTALVRVSPESYNLIIETYKNPLVNLMEVGLVGAVLFHALNGIRIMTVDFWSQGTAVPAADALGHPRRLGARDDPGHLLHDGTHRREPVRRCLMTTVSPKPTSSAARTEANQESYRGIEAPNSKRRRVTSGKNFEMYSWLFMRPQRRRAGGPGARPPASS